MFLTDSVQLAFHRYPHLVLCTDTLLSHNLCKLSRTVPNPVSRRRLPSCVLYGRPLPALRELESKPAGPGFAFAPIPSDAISIRAH